MLAAWLTDGLNHGKKANEKTNPTATPNPGSNPVRTSTGNTVLSVVRKSNAGPLIKRGIVHSMIARDSSLVSRLFHEPSAAAGSYIEYDLPVESTGDFELEIDVSTIVDNAVKGIVGLATANIPEHLMLCINSGQPKLYSDGQTPGQGTTNVADGKLWRLGLQRSGNNFIIKVNGSTEYTVAYADPSRLGKTYTIRVYGGQRNTSEANYYSWDGRAANFKYWNNGDKNTGQLIIDSPLDDDLNVGSAIANLANPSNPGTAYNLTSNDQAQWTKQGSTWVNGEDTMEIAYA